MKIISARDYQSMSRKAANIISAQVILYPDTVLGLATGSTPLGIYHQLIDWYNKGDLNLEKVKSVNLDEYCGLSGNHEQSYRYYMNINFFEHINILPKNTYLPDGMAQDYNAECKKYDKVICNIGGIDLQLLGIGNNGHIGFNEPNNDFDKTTHCVKLNQQTIEANAHFFTEINQVPKYAITMGIVEIMQAKKILMVASGKSKGDILYRSLFGPVTPKVPASILQLHDNLTVVADEEALYVILSKCPEAVG
jgi:glucosamine-6-phosphate deaminase